MSRIVITDGVAGVHELQNERGYRNQIGHTIVKRFKGKELECGQALDVLITNGGVIDANISEDQGGYFILSVTYSTESAVGDGGTEDASAVTTVWTREQLKSEKSLWSSPPWITLTDSMISVAGSEDVNDEFTRVGLRTAIEDYLSGSEPYETAIVKLATVLGSLEVGGVALNLNNETISQLVAHFRKGVESFPYNSWVIRRTQTGPVGFLANNDSTIGQLWTRATLIAQPIMPTVFQQFVQGGYYLQSGAQVAQIDTYRWQITQDWEFFPEADDWIYGTPI